MGIFRGRTVKEETPKSLTPDELAARLPKKLEDTIYGWPLADMPLRKDTQSDSRVIRAQATDSEVVRVTGLMFSHKLKNGKAHTAMRIGKGLSSILLNVGELDSRMAHLHGLFVDASIECEPLAEHDQLFADGKLQQIHGIEQPLRPGDRRGVLRGRVVHLHKAVIGDNTYGALIDTADAKVQVNWNPSCSEVLAQERITQIGSMALLAVEQTGDSGLHYMWHPGNVDARRYLLESPATI